MKLFTELPLEEIGKLEKLEGADINKAKIVLADEATGLLHGKECLKKIHETISNMFGGGGVSTESLPRVTLTQEDLTTGGGKGYLDLFLELGLATSKKDARRLIQGGGARMDDEKIEEETGRLTEADFPDGKTEITLRAGKKRAGVVELKV
mmetsp:Transcript_50293/g.75115  ORF Transcript_50293/g.75115 Transcript_50293/m.75115 type:complete len:151 (-) Transcript_50293:469-921(-)